jgi:hypothetical protein
VLEPPDRGHVLCTCGQRFEVGRFHPPERVSAAAQAAQVGSAPCARHARNAAVASCEHCGAFMCALCRIDAEGMAVCAACFERLNAAGQLASVRLSFRNYNGVAMQLAILALVLPFFAVLLGPIAVLLGFKGLRQGRELGETYGATRAKVAIALGLLETVLGVALLFSIFVSLQGAN